MPAAWSPSPFGNSEEYMEIDRNLLWTVATVAAGIAVLWVLWRMQLGAIAAVAKAEATDDIMTGAAEVAAAPDVALAAARDPGPAK
jgi:hypothetical protein